MNRNTMGELMDQVDWLAFFGPHRSGLRATHVGWLRLPAESRSNGAIEIELMVYTLSDGQRVFDAGSVEASFG